MPMKLKMKRETVAWGSSGRTTAGPSGSGMGRSGTGGRSEAGEGGDGKSTSTFRGRAPRVKASGRVRAMQAVRLTIFAAVAAGAVSFVMRSRLPEVATLGSAVPVTGSSPKGRTVSGPSAAAAAQSVYGYYILSRLGRQRAEAQEIATLRTVANDSHLTAKTRADAASTLDLVARWGREEVEIETLLASQGFPQSVVFISNDRATVVVPVKGLDAEKAAQIGTDVWNMANIPPQEVLVQPHR